ncbi:Na+/H+ antiporter subunit E [Actinosynnema sp. NPDC059797]
MVPIPPRGPAAAAAWGIRVGFVPDTVVVELDERKGSMLLHVLDARDPDAVIAAQLDSYERRQRRVFP